MNTFGSVRVCKYACKKKAFLSSTHNNINPHILKLQSNIFIFTTIYSLFASLQNVYPLHRTSPTLSSFIIFEIFIRYIFFRSVLFNNLEGRRSDTDDIFLYKHFSHMLSIYRNFLRFAMFKHQYLSLFSFMFFTEGCINKISCVLSYIHLRLAFRCTLSNMNLLPIETIWYPFYWKPLRLFLSECKMLF